MLKAVNTAATGMDAMQIGLDNISNNLANVNTTSYKKSKAEFQDLFYQTIREPGGQATDNTQAPTGVQVGVGVKTAGVSKIFEQGSAKVTNREMDMLLLGDGFFPVQNQNGEILYTRDGNFNRDATGRVVTTQGFPLVPNITIPPGTVGFNVTADGKVTVKTPQGQLQEIGNIEVANFLNPAGLKAMGGNMYQASEASGEPVQGKPGSNGLGAIQQRALEGSNVNIVNEMVNMIKAQRAYEMNAKVLEAADQMLATTTNTLK